MSDSTVKKVSSTHSPAGGMGQTYLASGTSIAMRLWEDRETETSKPERSREYETVGYVIEGRAELLLEDQRVLLERGDSWVVPRGARHTYRILEPFTAVEATHPPARAEARDESPAG